VPQVNLPIFAAGRNWANLKLTNADKKIKIAKYEKAIQTAFKETRDQLANRKLAKEQLTATFEIFFAKSKMNDLANKKFKQGLLSKIELADARTNMFSSNEDWALARARYLGSMINLYKVLGGGSQFEEKIKN
jgi:multidrug efflux system outer membrane protein